MAARISRAARFVSRPAGGLSASKTSARSMSLKGSYRKANMLTRSRARGRSRACRVSTRLRVNAVWAEHHSHERSGPRASDAWTHRGGHHHGLPDSVHADGARHVFRLFRLLPAGSALDGLSDLRPDGSAHLRRNDQ